MFDYIPDPIEIMDARIDDLAFEWELMQKNVPKGCFKCPFCLKIFDYDPIQVSYNPDSPVSCYECLPEHVKKAYDKFCGE